MFRILKLEELEKKIKGLQDYLGPRVDYNSDEWPADTVDRWLMEYMTILKIRYYRRIRYKNNKKK
jgi:hypothetical protein